MTSRAHTVDLLLLLAGESPERRVRSDLAAYLYHDVTAPPRGRREPLPILASGGHTGLVNEIIPQSQAIIEYLHDSRNVPSKDLYAEKESRDTIANFIYSDSIVRSFGAKRVGLVTSDYHMKRALWCGKRVFGTSITIEPFPAAEGTGALGKAVEWLTPKLLAHDLKGIQPGDQVGFRRYLTHKHPFHAPLATNDPEQSTYGAFIRLYKVLRR